MVAFIPIYKCNGWRQILSDASLKPKLQIQCTAEGTGVCFESPKLFPPSNLKSARPQISTGSFSRYTQQGLHIEFPAWNKKPPFILIRPQHLYRRHWTSDRASGSVMGKILICTSAGPPSYCWWACGSISLNAARRGISISKGSPATAVISHLPVGFCETSLGRDLWSLPFILFQNLSASQIEANTPDTLALSSAVCQV